MQIYYNLKCPFSGVVVLGLVDRRASKSGQRIHELGLSEIERSGLCSIPSCRHDGRRRERLPQASHHLDLSLNMVKNFRSNLNKNFRVRHGLPNYLVTVTHVVIDSKQNHGSSQALTVK